MGKAFIAFACGLLVLLSGCGSDKGGDLKTACTKTLQAQEQYRVAGGRVGLDFYNRAADLRLIATIRTLRTQVQRLAPLTKGAQRQRLEEFVPALSQQEKIFNALAVHDEAGAQKSAASLNEKAFAPGRRTVEQVCPKST
jgi:hypothetical protein